MKPTDEAKRLLDEIYHVYAFTTEGELSCTYATHAIDADDLPAIINKVLDAVEEQGKHHIEYILAHTSDDSMIRQIGIDAIDDYIDNINKLRP